VLADREDQPGLAFDVRAHKAELARSRDEIEALPAALSEREATNKRVVASFQESVKELAKLRVAVDPASDRSATADEEGEPRKN
jgi:hypothetical protein